MQFPGQLETANPGQPPIEDRPAMSTGLTSSQQVDSLEQSQGSRFKALPRDEQIALIRAHKNLGHPSPERLSTILRSQGYRPEVSQAALELRCSVCQAKTMPKLSRPGALKDDLDFNDRICIDGCNWTNNQGKPSTCTTLWIGPPISKSPELHPTNPLQLPSRPSVICGYHGREIPARC